MRFLPRALLILAVAALVENLPDLARYFEMREL